MANFQTLFSLCRPEILCFIILITFLTNFRDSLETLIMVIVSIHYIFLVSIIIIIFLLSVTINLKKYFVLIKWPFSNRHSFVTRNAPTQKILFFSIKNLPKNANKSNSCTKIIYQLEKLRLEEWIFSNSFLSGHQRSYFSRQNRWRQDDLFSSDRRGWHFPRHKLSNW